MEESTQYISSTGGTLTYNTPYGDGEYNIWVYGDVVISAIDICDTSPTVTPTPTHTPTPTKTATPAKIVTPTATPTPDEVTLNYPSNLVIFLPVIVKL